MAVLCALTTLSLRFHGARNACTAFSRRPHCAYGVKTQCRDFPTFPKFCPGVSRILEKYLCHLNSGIFILSK